MFKLFKILLPVFILFIAFSARAAEKIDIYFFYGDGCPHCAKEEIFLDKLEKENSDIVIHRYEVWHNPDNAKIFSQVADSLNTQVSGVPFLVIGTDTIPGYYNDEITGEKILGLIDYYTINGCNDVVAPVISGNQDMKQCAHGCDDNNQECVHDCGCGADKVKENKSIPERINVPVLGSIEIKNFSLPVLTIIIAALDGFNPCAMWVLLFLITLLLGMEDRKKMWILGSAFVVSSGAVYFLFLSAWLNLFLFLGFIFWIRIIIALVALASGAYNLREWHVNREAVCKVTKSDKRKKIFERLRAVVLEKKFIISLLGIIVLAAAVNMVELVCSAGLPAVYTQVLALSNLPRWQYYSYLFLYIIIFMLDDLIVFILAMSTLKIKAVSAKYTRWSSLIGGVIMVIIGLLLIFKPGWLMFG